MQRINRKKRAAVPLSLPFSAAQLDRLAVGESFMVGPQYGHDAVGSMVWKYRHARTHPERKSRRFSITQILAIAGGDASPGHSKREPECWRVMLVTRIK